MTLITKLLKRQGYGPQGAAAAHMLNQAHDDLTNAMHKLEGPVCMEGGK